MLPTDALEIARLVSGAVGAQPLPPLPRAGAAPDRAAAGRRSSTSTTTAPRPWCVTQGSGRKERIVGFGQYLPWNDGEVELSLLVRDDLQGRGLGRVLATRLIAAAAESGYRTAVATVLAENQRMLALARHLPQSRSAGPRGRVLEYRFDLTADDRTAVLTA